MLGKNKNNHWVIETYYIFCTNNKFIYIYYLLLMEYIKSDEEKLKLLFSKKPYFIGG